MPRPTKLSQDVQDKIVAALRVGATYEHAALVAGVSYLTFRRWMQQGEHATSGQFCEFCKVVKRAEAEASVRWLARIEQAANDGVWQAAAWKLERRYPEQWGRREHVQVQHEGTLTVEHMVAARTAILGALAAFPEARVRVAEALMELDAAHEANSDISERDRDGDGRAQPLR